MLPTPKARCKCPNCQIKAPFSLVLALYPPKIRRYQSRKKASCTTLPPSPEGVRSCFSRGENFSHGWMAAVWGQAVGNFITPGGGVKCRRHSAHVRPGVCLHVSAPKRSGVCPPRVAEIWPCFCHFRPCFRRSLLIRAVCLFGEGGHTRGPCISRRLLLRFPGADGLPQTRGDYTPSRTRGGVKFSPALRSPGGSNFRADGGSVGPAPIALRRA